MKFEAGGFAAFTGDDLAAECAEALRLPRQPIVDDCLHRHLGLPKRAGSCAAVFGLAGTGRKTSMRQMAASLPGSALVRAVSNDADMKSLRAMNGTLRDAGVQHCFYENAADLPDFIHESGFFAAEEHAGHAVVCGDSYPLCLADAGPLADCIEWFPTEHVLHGVADMEDWIEKAIVENLRRGAQDRSFRNRGFGFGEIVRLRDKRMLRKSIMAELLEQDDELDPADAWAVRNVLLRIGVYESSRGWKVMWVRSEQPGWPEKGHPQCIFPQLQTHLERIWKENAEKRAAEQAAAEAAKQKSA